MCLILFAVNPDDRYQLVVAANRDELYARPSMAADYWPQAPNILAGRDEDMGGTWLGVNRRGWFAAVTNFRETLASPAPPRSRGELPQHYLAQSPDSKTWLNTISQQGDQYKGFNLITADHEHCYYYGNRAGEPRQLEDGYYGLSNQLLDCDWPKVIDGRARLKSAIFNSPERISPERINSPELVDSPEHTNQPLTEALFQILMDQGDGREFSNSFIASDVYGTRAASVVLIEKNGKVVFEERCFNADGEAAGSRQFRFTRTDDF